MTELNSLKSANAKRWANVRLTRDFDAIARRLVAARPRYQLVEARTGVPWFLIAAIHEREASQRWDTQLGQGDPLNRVSVHVPAGRGPFVTWEEGAYDALVNCAPHASRWKDWSAGWALTLLEQYNGIGYAAKGKPSPYVWSGTDQYVSGKYVRDGICDPSVVDRQPGCAGLILAMTRLDPTITFTGVTIVRPKTTSTSTEKPAISPSLTSPAKGSIGAFIATIFNAILKRK
jgi:lysozyme family protein